MKLTRRNALIGMGTVAAGAGVIGGTGAFTSVEADRTVNVSTAGDGDAALQLAAVEDSDNAAEYVTTSGGQIQINLNGTGDDDDDVSSSGLNQDAKTTINNLVQVTNNGTQDLSSLLLSLDTDSNDIEETVAFGFTTGSDGSSTHENNLDDPVDVTDEGLDQGSSLVFGMIIDLLSDEATDSDPNELPSSTNYTLTIEANTS